MHSQKQFTTITKLSILIAIIIVPVFGYAVFTAFGGVSLNKTITSNPDLESGLVGHWTFDGPDMLQNVADRSGQGNTGYLTNFTSTTTAPGKIGQALNFDGIDDKVDLADIPFGGTNPISICSWVKTNNLTGNHNIISQGTQIVLRTKGSNLEWILNSFSSNDRVLAVSGITIGQLYQICGTYASGGDLILYVDASEIGRVTPTGSYSDVSNVFSLGNMIDTEFWDGIIDDVRIYNRALSADEITRLYQLGATTRINKTITSNPDLESGLVGHWTFDGKDMNDGIVDVSGNGYTGVLKGLTSTTTAPGRIGQALSFDGVDQTRVNADTTDNMTEFTACVWVNPNSLTNEDSDTKISLLNKRYDLTFNNTGGVNFSIPTDAIYSYVNSSVNISTGTWYNICAIHYGIGTAPKMYIDGQIQSGSSNVGTGIQADDSADPLYFGANNNSYAWNLDGSIDDVRIYNRALSADEIMRLYQLGR